MRGWPTTGQSDKRMDRLIDRHTDRQTRDRCNDALRLLKQTRSAYINSKRLCGRTKSDLLICRGERSLVWGHFVDNLRNANHLAFVVQYRHTQYVIGAIASLLVDVFVKAWILQSSTFHSVHVILECSLQVPRNNSFLTRQRHSTATVQHKDVND